MKYVRESLLERRKEKPEDNNLWHKLSLTQRFASTTLAQCGYELTYIRQSESGDTAILQRDKKVATICAEGYINTSPNISIRA